MADSRRNTSELHSLRISSDTFCAQPYLSPRCQRCQRYRRRVVAVVIPPPLAAVSPVSPRPRGGRADDRNCRIKSQSHQPVILVHRPRTATSPVCSWAISSGWCERRCKKRYSRSRLGCWEAAMQWSPSPHRLHHPKVRQGAT